MGRIGTLLRSKRNNRVSICRVSDLLKNGFDQERLATEFVRLNQEVWGGITEPQYLWSKEMLESHFKTCPHVIYCAFEKGSMVASLTNIVTTEDDMRNKSTWLAKTGDGFLTTHRPDGDVGFGVDLSVSKEASKGVSDNIVQAGLFVSVFGEGVKAVYLGSRIPGYHKYQHLTVQEYVFGQRKSGKPLDPELHFYLRLGFQIVDILPEYMDDPESMNYGVLIRWKNPLYWITKALPFLKPIIRFSGKLLFLRTPKQIASITRSE